MKRDDQETASLQLPVRITRTLRDLVSRAAESAGMGVSEWVRCTLSREAQSQLDRADRVAKRRR